MTISTLIHNAYSGLSTSQSVLRSISNNIANVNTPGYAREKVHLESLSTSQGGAGVKISQIERVADRFLERAAFEAAGTAGRYDKLAEFHSRLQSVIGRTTSESLISARMDSVFDAMANVAVDPADTVRRRTVVAEIERFAEEASRLSADIQNLRADASNQLAATVQEINGHLKRVADLNPQIVQAQISGSTTSALVEQRNQALNALSKLVDLSVQDMPDGSVQLSTSGGLMLLDKSARRLDYSSPGTAAPETNFPQIRISRYDSNSGNWADSGFVLEQGLAGGEAKALVDLRDSELPNVADNLGELVRVFTDEVNRVHNNNVAVPAPSRLEGRNSGLTVSDPHHFTGKTTFAMVDNAGRITAKTTVDFSSIGGSMADVLSAINGGLGGAATATLNNGRLALQSNVTGQGIAMVDDRVDPASRGTRGFSHFFGLNDLINPPQPVHLDTGVTAADPHRFDAGGTMNLQVRDENNRVLASTIVTITPGTYQDILNQLNDPNGLGRYVNFSFDGDGRLNPQPNPGFRGLDVHVVSDSTSRGATQRNFTDYFGIGQGVLASAAQKLSIKADVKSNPSALALARLDPALNVGDFAIGPGDFRGAADLRDINLRDLDFRASGNLSSLKTSIANFTGFMLGDAALAANRADTGKTDSNALYESVQKRRDDFSGVNLDEELGNMVVFQNSYNASARLITTAREMYDILLGLVQ